MTKHPQIAPITQIESDQAFEWLEKEYAERSDVTKSWLADCIERAAGRRCSDVGVPGHTLHRELELM